MRPGLPLLLALLLGLLPGCGTEPAGGLEALPASVRPARPWSAERLLAWLGSDQAVAACEGIETYWSNDTGNMNLEMTMYAAMAWWKANRARFVQ